MQSREWLCRTELCFREFAVDPINPPGRSNPRQLTSETHRLHSRVAKLPCSCIAEKWYSYGHSLRGRNLVIFIFPGRYPFKQYHHPLLSTPMTSCRNGNPKTACFRYFTFKIDPIPTLRFPPRSFELAIKNGIDFVIEAS